ncbi:hypothetical protein VTN00DRAFT_3199 [Thermoascus crustaceus]|uniref:uncharacterized protein n=1 Tax=Thermoascus crustaceus TaxID=5088 RepID=UPI003742D61F
MSMFTTSDWIWEVPLPNLTPALTPEAQTIIKTVQSRSARTFQSGSFTGPPQRKNFGQNTVRVFCAWIYTGLCSGPECRTRV